MNQFPLILSIFPSFMKVFHFFSLTKRNRRVKVKLYNCSNTQNTRDSIYIMEEIKASLVSETFKIGSL